MRYTVVRTKLPLGVVMETNRDDFEFRNERS